MPKDDLKYGDKPFVSQSNPHWAERQALMVEPTLPPVDDESQPPPAYPLDLGHLSQQIIARNEEARKRWFLTAFLTPEDQHLLEPSADPEPVIKILNKIKQSLLAPAGSCTPESLKELRAQVLVLFEHEKWLGDALAMVDNKDLPIDILNTLIQWQALKIEFGEYFFSLDMVPVTQAQPTVHHIIFAKSQLTLKDIRESAWGKIAEAHLQRLWNNRWEPTLKNFRSAVIGREIDLIEETQQLRLKSPSSLLVEYTLLTLEYGPSYVTPLYSFGYLAFEDFCAAAFLGGRPIQAYLPGAKGNLYWAHNGYYSRLMAYHDYFHAHAFTAANKPTFELKIKMVAIVANALVRTDFVKEANNMIDSFDITPAIILLTASSNTNMTPNALLKQRIKILTAIYTEFGLASGLHLTFSCLFDEKDPNLFCLQTLYHDDFHQMKLSFYIDITNRDYNSYLDDFNTAFNKIQSFTKKLEQVSPRQNNLKL